MRHTLLANAAFTTLTGVALVAFAAPPSGYLGIDASHTSAGIRTWST